MIQDEAKLDAAQDLSNELSHIATDIADQKDRLKKLQDDFAMANYATRLDEKTKESRELEDKKDALNGEFKGLSLQADSRARLDLKRAEIKAKMRDVKNTCVTSRFDPDILMTPVILSQPANQQCEVPHPCWH